MFYDFKDSGKPQTARKLLLKFLLAAEELNIPEFKVCVMAMHILNSFRHKYTNGFTEGCNNMGISPVFAGFCSMGIVLF